MAELTAAEIDSIINNIDTKIQTLLGVSDSTRTALDYDLGSKSVKLSKTVEALLKYRETMVKYRDQIAGGTKLQVVVPDYELDRLGNQVGDEQLGDD